MEAAIRIGQYLIPHARAAYDEMSGDPSVEGARRVLAWIEKNKVERVTVREVYRAVRGSGVLSRAEAVVAALNVLAERGYLRPARAERRGPGRPPGQAFDVHPLVYAG